MITAVEATLARGMTRARYGGRTSLSLAEGTEVGSEIGVFWGGGRTGGKGPYAGGGIDMIGCRVVMMGERGSPTVMRLS